MMEVIGASEITLFLAVAARLLGMSLTAPVFGNRHLAVRFRVVLALTMALVTWPMISEYGPLVFDSVASGMTAVGIEIFTGASMGLVIRVLFLAGMYAGQMIGHMCGLHWGQAYDPVAGEGSAPLARLFWWTSITLFVVLGGLGQLVTGVLDSFRALPAGNMQFPHQPIDTLVAMVGQSFQLGLRVGAAAVVALLLSTLFVGLLSRINSHVNSFQLGLPAQLAIGLIVTAVVLTQVPWIVVDRVRVALVSFTQPEETTTLPSAK